MCVHRRATASRYCQAVQPVGIKVHIRSYGIRIIVQTKDEENQSRIGLHEKRDKGRDVWAEVDGKGKYGRA